MANNEYYIELVLKKFKNGNDEVDAIIFLQENGFDTEEHKEIIEAAMARWQKEKLPFLAKKRKFAFALWGALTALMFYTDFFLLPNLILTGYKFVLCLIGTLALLFYFYLSVIYYKSWTTSFLEKYSNFKVSFQTFPFFWF